MPKFYRSLSDDLREWALSQPLFFVASAPLTGKHVNVSPKGMPKRTFVVFDSNHAAYIDHSGSGAETISHVYENGRVTVMFNSFDSSPRIMRLFCTGRIIEHDQPSFQETLERMGKTEFPGARAVILLDIFQVQTSCGFGVPLKASANDQGEDPSTHGFRDRDTLDGWATKQNKHGKMDAYRAVNNAWSLDGLVGMKVARRAAGYTLWTSNLRARFRRIFQQREALLMGAFLGNMVTVLLICWPVVKTQMLDIMYQGFRVRQG